MPHLRFRALSPLLKKSLSWSPIVGVLGPRQSGKTTLLKQFCSETVTFDDRKTESAFEASGQAVLEAARKPFFLDEVQKYPPIFDLLKMAVDSNQRPGQFLITGSVRFASKKDIRETLTGRAVTWELLPLTLAECFGKKSSPLLAALKKQNPLQVLKSLESHAWCKPSQIKNYSNLGGMPGICFLRDSSQRDAAFTSLLDTVIERDFYFVRPSKVRPNTLIEILREVGGLQGDPLNASLLARRFRVSVPTVSAILRTFEDLFLIRSHGKTYFFEDLGILNHLIQTRAHQSFRQTESLLFSELKALRAYEREEHLSLDSYSTRGGSFVPFILQGKTLGTVAIATDEGEHLSEKSLKGLYSFSKRTPHARLLHVHSGSKATLYKDKVLSIPITWVF